MTRFSHGLLAAVLATATATAAPVPEGASSGQGPLTDYLLRRAALPGGEAPPATRATVRGDAIEMDAVALVYKPVTREQVVTVQVVVPVQEERERVVRRDGRDVTEKFTVVVNRTQEVQEKRQYTTVVAEAVIQKRMASLKDCRFFVVTAGGKLDPLEAGPAAKRLAEPTAVLTGSKPTLDPGHLELVKPGTLYIVTPSVPTGPLAPGPVPIQDVPPGR